MSIRWMSWVWENGPDTPELRFTLLKLADNADDEGLCWPKVAEIAKKTCQSERTIQRHLKHLGDDGWIDRDVIVGGRGKAATMRLLRPIAKGRQNDTLSENETVTPMTPIPKIKGDTHDAERVTPMTQKGDTHDVSPTPPYRKNHQEPPLEPSKGVFTLPDWIPSDLWADYLTMRKKIGKPATERALHLAVKTLDKLRTDGHGSAAVLEQSILNSWQGLFELKQPKENVRHGFTKQSVTPGNLAACDAVIQRLNEGRRDAQIAGVAGELLRAPDSPGDVRRLPVSAPGVDRGAVGVGIQPSGPAVQILPPAGRTASSGRMPDRRPTF